MKRLLLLLALALILCSGSAEAALLGVNKVQLDFNNVLRNGYAEDTFYVSTGSQNNISISLNATGEIASWVRFVPNESFVMRADNPAAVRVIVEPPADARVDEYDGVITVLTGNLADVQGNLGAAVTVAFELKVKVRITDTQILDCTAAGFEIRDVEVGFPLEMKGTISNIGNVRIRPQVLVDVEDQLEKEMLATLSYTLTDEILPTTGIEFSAQLQHSLQPGQYWARINVPDCGPGESLSTFSVLEKGGISDVGELVRIDNNAWAVTDEIVPITAVFRNRGSRIVSAQFKGIVSKDGKIIENLVSDKLDVQPGETVPFEMFFRPKDTGQYRITGRVHYNNKITYERGSVLNVNEGKAPSGSDMTSWILVGVIIVIGILVFLILRKHKRRRARRFGF